MGKIIKPYEIISQLGQGGMGVVYKAQSLNLRTKVVAIKQLWQQYSQNPVFVKAFLDEGEKLFLLDHKNIVKVTDILEENGEYYIIMEFVEGRTLSEIIRKETGPIERKRAIKLFRQMLEGVAYIHSQPKPIIHRDLKPLNILVTSNDTVKITDFGIAKELDDEAGGHSTTVKGTPTYMSPEQMMDPKAVDIRTDIYSLGMTFYEMLCAKTPFTGDIATSPTAVYTAIINGNVLPPTEFYEGISEELSDFVMKAIHKDRNQRFANANEMLRELEKLERTGATTVRVNTSFPVHESDQTEIDDKVPSRPLTQKLKTRLQWKQFTWRFYSLMVVLILVVSYFVVPPIMRGIYDIANKDKTKILDKNVQDSYKNNMDKYDNVDKAFFQKDSLFKANQDSTLKYKNQLDSLRNFQK